MVFCTKIQRVLKDAVDFGAKKTISTSLSLCLAVAVKSSNRHVVVMIRTSMKICFRKVCLLRRFPQYQTGVSLNKSIFRKKNEKPKSPKILREKWILSSSITLIFFVRGAGAREGGVLLFYQPSFGEFRHISVSTSMGLRRCSNAARIAETNVQLRKNVKEMSHFTPWKINILNPKMEAWNLEDDFLFNWVILRFQTLYNFQGCTSTPADISTCTTIYQQMC